MSIQHTTRIAGLLIMTLATASLAACDGLCDNTVVSSASNQEKGITAQVIQRGCGATTPDLTIVAIAETQDATSFEDAESWVFVVEGKPNLKVAWTRADELTIDLREVAEVQTKESRLGDVKITYR